MGNQYLDVTKGYAKHQIDLVVPFFTFLEVSLAHGRGVARRGCLTTSVS